MLEEPKNRFGRNETAVKEASLRVPDVCVVDIEHEPAEAAKLVAVGVGEVRKEAQDDTSEANRAAAKVAGFRCPGVCTIVVELQPAGPSEINRGGSRRASRGCSMSPDVGSEVK
jgi:hypothetical protein